MKPRTVTATRYVTPLREGGSLPAIVEADDEGMYVLKFRAAEAASDIVWFDAYVSNGDRTARNAKLLIWHGALQLIDHGAALYFHHGRDTSQDRSQDPFTRIKDHILLPYAAMLRQSDAKLRERLAPQILEDLVMAAPEAWLGGIPRETYARYFVRRLESPRAFLEEAVSRRWMPRSISRPFASIWRAFPSSVAAVPKRGPSASSHGANASTGWSRRAAR